MTQEYKKENDIKPFNEVWTPLREEENIELNQEWLNALNWVKEIIKQTKNS